jgi:signal transduction histidine kinase
MSSAASAPFLARAVPLLHRHRKPLWAFLFVILVALLAAQAYALRAEVLDEVSRNLDVGLDVTQADVDSWSAARRSHAELLARIVAAMPPVRAARDSSAPYAGLLEALVVSEGYAGVWVYDPHGRLIDAHARDSIAAPPPPSGPKGNVASEDEVITRVSPSSGHGAVALDFPAAAEHNGVSRGMLVLRVSPGDSTFRNLNPTRNTNRTARSSLLLRVGDSVQVVATRSHAGNAGVARVLPLAAVPPYVRAALDGQRSHGVGRGLFGAQVAYAGRPALAPGWALVREMETSEFEERLRWPLIRQALVLGALVILLALLATNRTRAAIARRERELARLRTEFVASASHELRTPLAQIRMFSELLRTGALRTPEDTDRALRVIEKESRRLSTLVDNLLNFAQLRRGAESETAPSCDIGAEARQVIADFEWLIAERNVTIDAKLEADAWASVDGRAIRQVLINFLDNAIKYGPPGQTITVRVGTLGNKVRLSVEDEGPGIPERERDAIWQAFYRRETAVASRVNGSGIGLAVVRDLVLQSAGAVHVDSVTTGGARFVADFPRAVVESPEPAHAG